MTTPPQLLLVRVPEQVRLPALATVLSIRVSRKVVVVICSRWAAPVFREIVFPPSANPQTIQSFASSVVTVSVAVPLFPVQVAPEHVLPELLAVRPALRPPALPVQLPATKPKPLEPVQVQLKPAVKEGALR